ncbi:MAG: transposase [Chloroflexi bacterium]|nr:MAG: transposase [Chloroflexota bacterium]
MAPYARPYDSNNQRLLALPDFVDRYNNNRPHSALKGLTPMASLVNNVSGNHT